MKLDRKDIVWWNEEIVSDKNGRFVDYSEELENAWDKQQPLKVLEISGWISCPNCSKDICGVDNSEVYSILDLYCNKCGQKLEW